MDRNITYGNIEMRLVSLEKIGKNLDFDCGVQSINSHFTSESLKKISSYRQSGIFLIMIKEILVGFYSVSLKNYTIEIRAYEPLEVCCAHLDYFGIQKEFQNKGIGKLMLNLILSDFKYLSEKYRNITGFTLVPLNSRLENFYESLNFTKIKIESPEDEDYYWVSFLKE